MFGITNILPFVVTRDFQADAFWCTIILGVQNLGQFMGSIITGKLSDILGNKVALMSWVSLAVCGSIGNAFVGDVIGMTVLRFFSGLFSVQAAAVMYVMKSVTISFLAVGCDQKLTERLGAQLLKVHIF